jgi:hypothetical protein
MALTVLGGAGDDSTPTPGTFAIIALHYFIFKAAGWNSRHAGRYKGETWASRTLRDVRLVCRVTPDFPTENHPLRSLFLQTCRNEIYLVLSKLAEFVL